VPNGKLAEDRHHDQPAIGELVVAHHGVTVVAGLAPAAESLEHVARLARTIEHEPGRVELLALLREDRHARVDDLHDVIGSDRQRVVRWVPEICRPLRP
jgi:hypothetical protein